MSGLSMELTNARVHTNSKAQIFGPNMTTFNYLALDNLPKKISVNWLSGRKASPQNGSIFYAPEKTVNVSRTYFDDQAARNATKISALIGPAVHEDVIGTAWGISANISCRSTPDNELQMIRIHGLGNCDIKGCAFESPLELSNNSSSLPKWSGSKYQETASVSFHGMSLRTGSIGLGLHCDVDTSVGVAALDPIQRTFSRFKSVPAKQSSNLSLSDPEISPMQNLALGALSSNQVVGSIVRPLQPSETPTYLRLVPINTMTTLNSIQKALNTRPSSESFGGTLNTPLLGPENLQQAMYKLFGETLITMMEELDPGPWYGDLYSLRQTRYLVRGAIPCVPVFVLLALWALIMGTGALWLIFLAGPRWAPSLDGFEMFKFGAKYHGETNDLEDVNFQKCTEPLSKIPGMVGLLPGEGHGSSDRALTPIGLSDNEAIERDRKVKFKLHGKAATQTRPSCQPHSRPRPSRQSGQALSVGSHQRPKSTTTVTPIGAMPSR
ncbi:MAG: hypothetical protein Q9160_001415 [Pyrenula sp. 1 TL-2023]